MFNNYNLSQSITTSQVSSWETYEEHDGMTIIERHEIINGIEVINRVY